MPESHADSPQLPDHNIPRLPFHCLTGHCGAVYRLDRTCQAQTRGQYLQPLDNDIPVLVIIKLTKFVVPVRLCCSSGKLNFCNYFIMFFDI